ncbi:type IV toxin-antitoxin system AbiEi family antitoxin domain-containing protein [Rhodococcoides fascians]|uniref:type IV toxin-antitoxin system AbiEi family antitoxin domain-containing protein n=1 Tax=Rhodococcoides fascians TaxID=1828 RepID=UPI003211D06B
MTTSDVRRRQAGLPPEFARLPMRMVRAATAADVYAHPRAELARLTDLGLLHRVATGFYVAVPDDLVGTEWMPGLEAAAAGIAVAAYSADDAVVMGVSTARLHGAIPRALATAVVAVPTRHDPIRLADRQAVVRFVVRDTARLDAERIDTELGPVLVTTAEQTVLDLVKRPGLGDAEGEVWPAVEQLYRKCDPEVLAEIAEAQKMRTTLTRMQDRSGEKRRTP